MTSVPTIPQCYLGKGSNIHKVFSHGPSINVGFAGIGGTSHIPRLTLGPPAVPSADGDAASLAGEESEADILPFALDADMQMGYESLRGHAAQISPTGQHLSKAVVCPFPSIIDFTQPVQ
jgi:hypothetical protein